MSMKKKQVNWLLLFLVIPAQHHLEPSWVVVGRRSSTAYILGRYEEAKVPETVWGFNKFTWIYKNAGSGVSLEHE
jgi:hypothetical protein